MSHVFISYKHADDDRTFALQLRNQLLEEGLETWIDEDISPGEIWSHKIDEAIRSAFALIVVMTPEARQSEFVTYEWSFAIGLGIPIIPVLLKDMELHPKLNELQYVNYTHPARQSQAWQRLLSTLKQHRNSPPRLLLNSQADLVTLIDDLQSGDGEIRRNAARLLGELREVKSIPYLVEVLSDKRPIVREEAAKSLGEIGDPTAVTGLLRALHNSKAHGVRMSILWALRQIGDVRSIPALKEIAQFARHEQERLSAVKTLVLMANQDSTSTLSISALIDVLSNVWFVPKEGLELIIDAVAIQGNQTASQVLLRLLDRQSFDQEIKNRIIVSLTHIGTSEALAAVEQWKRGQVGGQA